MKRWLFWLPALTWAGMIFFLSSRGMGPQPSWWFTNADKVIHGILFGILSLLVFLALRRTHGWRASRAAALAFTVAVLYGSSDEIHQFTTPGRTPDVSDLAADAIGASMVFLACLKKP
jgi:VanZ family protein